MSFMKSIKKNYNAPRGFVKLHFGGRQEVSFRIHTGAWHAHSYSTGSPQAIESFKVSYGGHLMLHTASRVIEVGDKSGVR